LQLHDTPSEVLPASHEPVVVASGLHTVHAWHASPSS
jgi:hypothetical protein